jgi:hypothetical protein
VLAFCELTGREVEYVALSRDTTESDLKQRREIRDGGTSVHVDAAPVRAALEGRLLILDGIEKAERNVCCRSLTGPFPRFHTPTDDLHLSQLTSGLFFPTCQPSRSDLPHLQLMLPLTVIGRAISLSS